MKAFDVSIMVTAIRANWATIHAEKVEKAKRKRAAGIRTNIPSDTTYRYVVQYCMRGDSNHEPVFNFAIEDCYNASMAREIADVMIAAEVIKTWDYLTKSATWIANGSAILATDKDTNTAIENAIKANYTCFSCKRAANANASAQKHIAKRTRKRKHAPRYSARVTSDVVAKFGKSASANVRQATAEEKAEFAAQIAAAKDAKEKQKQDLKAARAARAAIAV